MHIAQVELQNIGPHRSLTVNFGCGLVGLIGANGAGKSTLVNAIYAALTNDFSRLGNTKADIITNGSNAEPSYICVTGKHQNQSFVLTRWLRPNKNEFKIGKLTFDKTTEVNEAIIAYLNISKAVVDKYVFVNQWEMFSFLDQTTSERAKAFQYLCGTEAASGIHKSCLDYVARQQGIEVVDNRFELEEAIDETRLTMVEHSKTGRAAKLNILTAEGIEACQKLLAKYELGKEAKVQLKAIKQKIVALELSLTRLQQSQSKHKLTRLEVWQAKFKPKVIAAQQLVDKVKEYVTAFSNYAGEKIKHKEFLDLLVVKRRNMPKPNKDYAGLKNQKLLIKERYEIEFQLNQVSALLAHPDKRQCSQCRQEVTEQYVADIQTEYAKNTARLAGIVRILNYAELYDAKLAQHLKQVTDLEKLCTAAGHTAMQADPEVALLFKDLEGVTQEHKDKAKALLQRSYEIEQQRFHLDQVVRQEQHRILGLQGELKSSLEQRYELQQQISNMPGSEEVSVANVRICQHQESVAVWQKSLGAYQEAKRSWLRTKKSLEQLTVLLTAREKVRELLTTVSAAGDVFHWNNLPKLVSQSNLQLLVGDINANLQLFNNPFFVEADADLTFNVFFAGQESVKAKQLSGGQKVILSIAFRAALDRVFGHNIGMMFLDEPTSGLDADNVSFFREALQQLAQKVGEEHQLIVITHVQELGKVFDQLIEIKR